jgi:hypothetical protein
VAKKEARCFFLSHCWQMPFHSLVNGSEIEHSFVLHADATEREWDFYYWIDVFCKNQHLPAPATDEFKYAMKSAGTVLPFFLLTLNCILKRFFYFHSRSIAYRSLAEASHSGLTYLVYI